jgi:4-hydroxy-tetrahydrodipicolinate synthase
MRTTWTGCGTALVTPFTTDGAIDEPAIRRLARRQIDAGMHFLVPCGTTGESPTLSREEKRRVVELVVAEAAGKVPVLAGAGGYDTHEVIESVQEMAAAGAQGILSVTPYYNKPTQEGLYRHFRAIAEAAPDLPMIPYNIQGRTAINIETETMARLAQIPNIVGVKEASGSLDQMTAVILACGPDFSVLSGDDSLTLPLMAVGGRGVISVVANFLPREVAELTHAALDGDWKRARDLHWKLFPICRGVFIETNPIPVKEAMAMLGLIRPEWRLPMCPMSDGNREKLRKILTQAGVLKT